MKCKECNNQVIVNGFESFCKSCGLVAEDEPVINEGFTNKNPYSVSLSYFDEVFNRNKRDVELLCNFFKVSNYVEKEALRVFRECLRNKLSVGRSLESISMASFYLATQIHDYFFDLNNFKEFDAEIKLEVLWILTCRIAKNLNIKVNKEFNPKSDLLRKFISDLKLPEEIFSDASELLTKNECFLKRKSNKAKIVAVLFYLSKNKGFKHSIMNYSRVGNISPAIISNIVGVLK